MMFQCERLGTEAEPIVIIDDFYAEPDRLISHAARLKFVRPSSLYPGIQADAPTSYILPEIEKLIPIFEEVFGFSQKKYELVQCAFGIVTLLPHELTPEQRVPHFDTTDPNRLALLHYLSEEDISGGTNFYRHRATNFERVTKDRLPVYAGAIGEEYAAGEIDKLEYISGDTSLFEKIGSVRAKVNRLVIYRSCLLHSGYIPTNSSFSSNPRTGRLTINTFVQAV